MFFGLEGESRHARSRCQVTAECREHASTVGEPYGIWDGLSAAERQTPLGRKCVWSPGAISGGTGTTL
jgi:hypothetical protein